MKVLISLDLEGSCFKAGIADSAEELEEVYRLRHKVYAERLGQVPPSADGREVDWCDDHSWHVLARFDDRLVGAFRLIDCSKGYLLQEGVFDGQRFQLPATHPLTGESLDPALTVEGSRWIAMPVPPLPSGRYLHISMQLMKAVMLACEDLGKRFLLGAVHVPELRRFTEVYNWPAGEIVPGEHDYHGSRVGIVVFEVNNDYTCPVFKERDPAGDEKVARDNG